METLHSALQIEVLKYLPPRMLVRKGLVSRELQELSNHQYLIRQYPHIMLADKPVLLESVFFNLDIDLVPQLIELTDQIFKPEDQLLWCLVQATAASAAWSADAAASASEFAESVAWDATRSATMSAARSAAWSDAWSGALFDALSIALFDALFNAESAAIIKRKVSDLTSPEEIGKASYLVAERYYLVNLDEIYNICQLIIEEHLPNYREITVELPETDNPFIKQFHRLFKNE